MIPTLLQFEGGKGRIASSRATFPFILLLLDLWTLPLLITIGTMGAGPSSAVSIAAVSISTETANCNNSLESGKQPGKLIMSSGPTSETGEPGTYPGILSLSFGGLVYNHPQPKKESPEPEPSSSSSSPSSPSSSSTWKKTGEMKRGSGGETRVTSNQDVTTLALAVDNSSSVAIANINSSWNNVYVTIGTPTSGNFQFPNPSQQSQAQQQPAQQRRQQHLQQQHQHQQHKPAPPPNTNYNKQK